MKIKIPKTKNPYKNPRLEFAPVEKSHEKKPYKRDKKIKSQDININDIYDNDNDDDDDDDDDDIYANYDFDCDYFYEPLSKFVFRCNQCGEEENGFFNSNSKTGYYLDNSNFFICSECLKKEEK